MEAAKNRRRLIVLTIVLGACFVTLGCRLVDLQVLQHEDFARLAEDQHDHFYYREAPRGDILDRRGSPLATSVPVKRICADPSILREQREEIARFLAPLFKTNEIGLLSAFSRTHLNKTGGMAMAQYVVLRNKVPVDEWEKIRSALTNQFAVMTAGRKFTKEFTKKDYLKLKYAWTRGVFSEDDQIRTYPSGQLAAHVLGFTGSREIIKNGHTNSMVVGAEGIEATFDEKLHGARGWVKTETTSGKQEIFIFREQDVEARPGLNVVLTIDSRVQQIVEEELVAPMTKHSAQSVSAIVIRPRTGEILAMATLPTFDPNRPGRGDVAARRNRIITDVFEPGSTFKTVTLAGALNDGAVRLTDRFDCENGAFTFAGRVLHDHEHYQVMSVEEIISKSSNIGTAKVAIRMGKERTFKYIWDFGFGQRTGIPLTGEVGGILPKPKDWALIHISRIPIGQGVAATPLQTAMALSAIANGGVLMRPMIVDRLTDEKGQTVVKYEPQVIRRVVSHAAAKQAVTALKTVVQTGTADKARLENYTVAGKTGTGEKPVHGVYTKEKYYASFIGFFPADDPELCIAVSVDEPLKRTGYYGAQVAAPVFKRIAERAANFLNIKPDLQPGGPNDVMADRERSADRPGVAQVRERF
jgi:cell division protein FtsI/penicillin-binding protein 2